MKECSRKVVFVPVGENPTRLTKPLSQIKRNKKTENTDGDEDHDENDIWMTNIVERYENRPDKHDFETICLAEFCSEFRVLAKSQIPKTANETVFKLQNEKGYIKKRTRTQPAIIRYPRFNAEKMTEKYYQSLLQLFLPYRNGSHLKPPPYELFETFYEQGHIKFMVEKQIRSVKSIVDQNHARFAQNEKVIDEAMETFENIGEPEDAWANLCPETESMRQKFQRERGKYDDCNEQLIETIPDMQETTNADVPLRVEQRINSRDEILPVLQTLNKTQIQLFYHVREWCLMKSLGQNPNPLQLFITGGAGTGKSHLIKAIHYEASRLLEKQMLSPESVTVLLAAFTGTAAFNIGGNTLHHLFSLPKFMTIPYEPLKEQS